MFRIYDRRISTYCDGLSRRSFLQLGVAGVASVSLADVLRAKANPRRWALRRRTQRRKTQQSFCCGSTAGPAISTPTI